MSALQPDRREALRGRPDPDDPDVWVLDPMVVTDACSGYARISLINGAVITASIHDDDGNVIVKDTPEAIAAALAAFDVSRTLAGFTS
jgi:hypothetical protein